MSQKPAFLRRAAKRDAERAVDYLIKESAHSAAEQFVGALQQAYAHLSRFPASGSPRYAHELNLPGVRSWRVPGFPYLVFYVELQDRIDVLRVLHAQRDIPASLQTEDES